MMLGTYMDVIAKFNYTLTHTTDWRVGGTHGFK